MPSVTWHGLTLTPCDLFRTWLPGSKLHLNVLGNGTGAVWLLEPAWKTHPLKSKTRQNYLERIRYLYRWARDNVAGAQDLPELPYESFAVRRARRNGS